MRFSCVSLLIALSIEPSLGFCPIRAAKPAFKRRLHAQQEWSIADDWNTQSDHENRPAESRDLFHQDIVGRAAFYMQDRDTVYSEETLEHDAYMSQVVQDIHPETTESYPTSASAKVDWILNELDQDEDAELNDSGLDEELMDQEIAQLIRCNEEPEQFLIQQGRAVPSLTEEEQYDVRQLVTYSAEEEHPSATPFFQQAVAIMFQQYAKELSTSKDEEPRLVLDKPALAAWLQRSLSVPCGPHDSRVTKLISTSGKYGQGYLELDDFQSLYLQAVVGVTNKQQAGTSGTPPADPTAYFYNRLKQQRTYEIDQVWKDLEIHGVEPPSLVDWKERVRALEQEQQQQPSGPAAVLTKHDSSVLFHDECDLVDPDDAAVDSWTQNKDTGTWKRTGKSSHEKIELCKCSSGSSNNDEKKTPVRFKDGDFVYIDEESCIGCTQCALAAPGSFLMLENGRARTFQQDVSPAVAAAVTTCPVNCMHYVGFDRLVELEKARDDGILPSRPGDTHRHFGTKQTQATKSATNTNKKNTPEKQQEEEASQWIAHTPLYVSRMQSSDANHKESIYHYLRNQCYKSSACPQKGCFDCPIYASNPTSNPHWQKRVKADYHVRAQHFQENTNLADAIRKKADL